MNGCMAPFRSADRPRTADIPFRRRCGIVSAFTKGAANRMNGREVEHIKSHRSD